MKSIRFKARPEYSGGRSRPTKHFKENLTNSTTAGPGLTKNAMAALPDGISVIHRQPTGKQTKKLIAKVFGNLSKK